jgi:hypothetical protein
MDLGEKMNFTSHKASILRVAFLAIIAAIVLWPAAAHADSYIDYTVDGTFDSTGTLSGTFTIDTTSGQISSANILADGVNFTCPGGSLGTCVLYTTLDGGISAGFVAGDPSESLYLSWPDSADLSGFALTTEEAGVTIGSYCEGCTAPGVQDFLASGNAIDAPPANAPEPGTWVLLLAGLAAMGFIGLRRREAASVVA